MLTFFFVGPHLRMNGEPMFLLDIVERKFIIFGKIFWPQDFYLFVIAMIGALFTIVLFTVIYGRVWCGWTCPQTILMEMVFRKIEFWIEGNALKQKKLNDGGIGFEWVWKKISKHGLFLIVSVLISHTLLSYFIGFDEVKKMVTMGPSTNMSTFVAMFIFTAITYGVFSKFREQVCVLVCPYGRLQGVLLDANSLVVAYDYKRGEPKAPYRKREDRDALGKGDCIDCKKCVSVCPTGIDIRNGTQLECINCTACIDACNTVMKSINKPKGLIRIASENIIRYGTKFKFTGRIIGYSVVVFILMTSFVFLFTMRNDVDTTILHVPGSMYNKVSETELSNIYNFKSINKSAREFKDIEVKLLSHPGKVQMMGSDFSLSANESLQGMFLITMDKTDLEPGRTKIEIGIFSGDELIEKENSTFIGP